MHALNTENGVNLKMSASLDKFLPSSIYILMLATVPTQVGFVLLKSGEKIAADVVILGAGVIPKTDFLKESGITLDRDGGITVTSTLAVPSVNDVYAVGKITL